EFRDYSCRALLGSLAISLDYDLGRERRFVWIVNAGEVLKLASQRFLVQTLDVALGEHIDRALAIYLNERDDLLSNLVANLAIRRNRRGNRHHIVASKQMTHEPYAPNVCVAILF